MRKIPYIHIILFITTFLTTLTAGAFQKGIDIFAYPERIIEGFPFAGTLLTILLFHEFSHYLASKKHHTRATLPYFIPAPPIFNIIGTFGAFIKIKSPIVNRKALIDIGASGPIAGFVISVIACIAGLLMSKVVPLQTQDGVIALGDSLLFSFLSRIILGATPDAYDIVLHPVAFAGWIGLFVTSLNLIPIGQLDGGHIAFALIGDRHKKLSIGLVIVLAVLGFIAWEGWVMWAVLLLIVGIKHPPVIYWEAPIDPVRQRIAFVSFIIFVITFIPSPFKIIL